jgi:hypothetical protein
MKEEDVAAVRAARNQSLFRGVNEKIEEINETFESMLERMDCVCECADDGCMERIEVSLKQYEEMRRVPTHFMVSPGHVLPDVERVVRDEGQFVVVEKLGEAGMIARQLDPRRERVSLQT